MIDRTLRFTAVIAFAGLLSACVSAPPLAPAGRLAATGDAHVTLDRDWSDVTKLFAHRAVKTHILSLDGVLLNRLYVSEGLMPADPLMVNPARGDAPTAPAPRGKADMSLSEQMEFVANSVAALDYQKVETSDPQPVSVGGAHGVRFAFTARTGDGLNMRGLAQAVPSKGKSYYIVYIAPAEHYYAASLKNATAVMDSETLP